jgi:hypothetical protein
MPFQRLTLADLQADLKASWDSSPFWTDAEATRYINHALRFWNLLTGFWKETVLVSTPNPVSPYVPLPGALTFGMQVIWGATSKPLQLSGLFDLDMGRPRWEEETTASGGEIPTIPTLWCPSGMKELVIWPQDATMDQPLLIDGVAATPVLVNPGDFIDLGDQDAGPILDFALHVAAFKRGQGAMSSTALRLQAFLQAARAQNGRLAYSLVFRKALGLDHVKGAKPIVNMAPAQQEQPGG